tara:strand:+ start:16652 stop:16885 length:234 start_codon:yes stop_codon:yes gene_type:complete
MKLEMLNAKEVDEWLRARSRLGRLVISTKGPPPKNATYSDGTPIARNVNVAWHDTATGESIDIHYKQEDQSDEQCHL